MEINESTSSSNMYMVTSFPEKSLYIKVFHLFSTHVETQEK